MTALPPFFLDLDMWFLLEKTVLISIIFLFSFGIGAYSTYGERKIAAFLQDRLGPNRAGKFGILQPLADGVKFFFKEDFIPNRADVIFYTLAPALFMITVLMTLAVIPWGPDLHLGTRIVQLQIVDINIGILYVFAMTSVGGYGIMFGGWASANKFALLGSLRAAAQMISYELAIGLSIAGVLIFSDSFSLRKIIEVQIAGYWNILNQPLGFLIFLICSFAECSRAPFDLPESESELIGGFHTEYSSMKLGMFLFAEYIHMFIASALIVCLFFGGYHLPGVSELVNWLGLPNNLYVLLSVFIFIGKILFFIFFFMWVRWSLPRFRYDQLMRLGWLILLPLALINLLLTSGLVSYFLLTK